MVTLHKNSELSRLWWRQHQSCRQHIEKCWRYDWCQRNLWLFTESFQSFRFLSPFSENVIFFINGSLYLQVGPQQLLTRWLCVPLDPELMPPEKIFNVSIRDPWTRRPGTDSGRAKLTWTITRALWSFIFIKWMKILKFLSVLCPRLFIQNFILSNR